MWSYGRPKRPDRPIYTVGVSSRLGFVKEELTVQKHELSDGGSNTTLSLVQMKTYVQLFLLKQAA